MIKRIKFAAMALTAVVAFNSNAGIISYTGSIESWTIDTSGSYRVTAIGAQGASAQNGRIGGRGASMSGVFDFFAGDTYFLAVGGAGTHNNLNGAGGGGSFLVDSSNNPLLIAGGGGGTRQSVSNDGCDASISQFAGLGSASAGTFDCVLKTDALSLGQGGIISSTSWGSAGAGFFSNGAVEYASLGNLAAQSWLNGLAGGIQNRTCGSGFSFGGFGGGGTGSGCGGGGGGGGYSGGDGGRIAGGGSSFNLGRDQVNIAGLGYGNGYIEWELLSAFDIDDPTDLPAPGTLALIGLSLFAIRKLRK